MDSLHVVTSLPLLDAGYDMLLEKPVCNNEKELALLEECVKRNDSKLMICHVLRYAPFYRRVKQLILDGEIGEVVNIRTDEHVAYNHASAAFIRGKWNNEKRCGSTMLLQKCCHDLDLICWLNPFRPTRTASFGGRNFLIPEKAPRMRRSAVSTAVRMWKTVLTAQRKFPSKRIFFLSIPARE